MIQPPAVGDGGSSRRKGIVAKENGASLDWIIVVVVMALMFILLNIVVREADLGKKNR